MRILTSVCGAAPGFSQTAGRSEPVNHGLRALCTLVAFQHKAAYGTEAAARHQRQGAATFGDMRSYFSLQHVLSNTPDDHIFDAVAARVLKGILPLEVDDSAPLDPPDLFKSTKTEAGTAPERQQ